MICSTKKCKSAD